jgi:hypothetical protein
MARPASPRMCPAMFENTDEPVLTDIALRKESESFLKMCGLDPTADAVDQMIEVFIPCLRIMCERPWSKKVSTWRNGGRLSVLGDLRKKFERVWYRYWLCNRPHPDSIFDLINYAGFVLRSADDRWGSWGEPGSVDPD